MGLDGEGASPGGGGNGPGGGPPRGYLGATTPPYLSTSRSPSLPPQFPYPPDAGLSVYTSLGKRRTGTQFSCCEQFYQKMISMLASLQLVERNVERERGRGNVKERKIGTEPNGLQEPQVVWYQDRRRI